MLVAQGVSQTAWAFSKLGLPKHALFLAVAAAARPKLATYDPQVSTHGLLYSSFHVLIGRFAGTAGAGNAGVGVRKLGDRAWKADRRDLCAGAEMTAEIIAEIIAEACISACNRGRRGRAAASSTARARPSFCGRSLGWRTVSMRRRSRRSSAGSATWRRVGSRRSTCCMRWGPRLSWATGATRR